MGAKVTFDEINKIIQVTLAPVLEAGDWVIDIDFKIDIYSDGKEDWLANQNLRRRPFPVRPVGGDPLPGSKALGSTFFLDSDWKIKPYGADHVFRMNGNVYSEDGTSPFVSAGAYGVTIINTVSSLVDSTVQQLNELQYTSYQNSVWVDPNTATSGLDYPSGTREYPVNNLDDAINIANDRGFDTLHILDSMVINGNHNIEKFTLVGVSSTQTAIEILDSALTQSTLFRDLTILGILDGGSTLTDCVVNELNYVNGQMHHCMINGPVTLGGATTAHLHGCYSGVPGVGTPTINMGGSGNSLALRDYNGGIKITNLTANDPVSIDINSGQIILDSTVTAGIFRIGGVGVLYDNSTGTSVEKSGLMSKETVSQAVWDADIADHLIPGSTGLSVGTSLFEGAVHIDVNSGNTGVDFPIGTNGFPVNNLLDAISIATTRGIGVLDFDSDFTFDNTVNIADYVLQGHGLQTTTLTFETGSILANCHVQKATITGFVIGITGIEECMIDMLGSVNPLASTLTVTISKCLLRGVSSFPPLFAGKLHILDCWGMPTDLGEPPTLDMNGGAFEVQIRNYSGFLSMDNCTQSVDVRIFLNSGGVTLNSTVTDGDFIVTGVGALQDNSQNGTRVDSTGLVQGQIIDDTRYAVESLRPHHAGYGKTIYWDTFEGNDNFNGKTPALATKTFAAAQDLATDGGHDIIVALANDTGTQTFADEAITISKNYLFLRGPGRDFVIKPTSTTAPSISIEAKGAEVSGMVVETAVSGGQAAMVIRDGSDFALIENVWSHNAQGDALMLEGTMVYARVNGCFFSHAGAHGIHINGNVRHTKIENTELDASALDGIRIEGAGPARNNIIGSGVKIYGSGEWGVNLMSGVKRNYIDFNSAIYDNTLGKVLDNGVLTEYGETDTAVAVWDSRMADHTEAGTYGDELATTADVMASNSTVSFQPASVDLVGTDTSGDITDTYTRNNVHWEITEDASNGLTFDVHFNLDNDNQRNGIFYLYGRYQSDDPTHFLELWAWNTETASWELMHDKFAEADTADSELSHQYFERHINREAGQEVIMRVIHNSATYSASHKLFVDYLSLSSIEPLTKDNVADAVWDEAIADHLSAGSTGNKLNTASSGGVDYDSLAQAVWDRNLGLHTTAGSAGKLVKTTHDIEAGEWELVNNQMIFKDPSGVEMFRVNLFDSQNAPSMEEVYKRTRV